MTQLYINGRRNAAKPCDCLACKLEAREIARELSKHNVVMLFDERGTNLGSYVTGIYHEPFFDNSTPVPLDAVKAHAIEHAVAYTNGNLSEAAKLLGIGRTTLYRAVGAGA